MHAFKNIAPPFFKIFDEGGNFQGGHSCRLFFPGYPSKYVVVTFKARASSYLL
jgi:hypothetical protein